MGDTTRLLHQARAGEAGADDALFSRVYDELMQAARRRLSAGAMRNVVIDFARERLAQKRGAGAQRVTLTPEWGMK